MVRCACGSRSMRQTRCPCSARAAPRLAVVVVLPTPPFWFISAMIRMIRLRACVRANVKAQIMALRGRGARGEGQGDELQRGEGGDEQAEQAEQQEQQLDALADDALDRGIDRIARDRFFQADDIAAVAAA